ncbi:MAG TPA: YciI family protein [Acetobacteraceae bacterium]|nr:YciI family protein [Acetobacteraceae bacterium]
MLYAILCYHDEAAVGAWTQEQDAACMARIGVVLDGLAGAGRLGPVARLVPTSAAVTLRKGREDIVLDGPFAETKEQLLGFYVVDCATLDDAVAAAKELAHANPGLGAYELRPVAYFRAGGEAG